MDEPPRKRHLSRFLTQTLMRDEQIVLKAQFHWMYTLQSWILAGVFFAGGFGIAALLQKTGAASPGPGATRAMVEDTQRLMVFLPVAGLGMGGLVFLTRMLRKWTTEIVLTDRRFLFKRGIFSIVAHKLGVNEINYCNVHQSLVGHMLNYGQLYMFTYTLDDRNIELPAIADPHALSSAIEEVKKFRYG